MKLWQVIGKEVQDQIMEKVSIVAAKKFFTPAEKNVHTAHIGCRAKNSGLPCLTKSCTECDYFVLNDRRR